MKIIFTVLPVGLALLYSCSPKEPEAILLVGSWDLIESKGTLDSTWKQIDRSFGINVVFRGNGTVGTKNRMPFNGGWCNDAERYIISHQTISLQYGDPKCIPFVNNPVPSDAKILALTSQLLILDYGSYLLKFERQ